MYLCVSQKYERQFDNFLTSSIHKDMKSQCMIDHKLCILQTPSPITNIYVYISVYIGLDFLFITFLLLFFCHGHLLCECRSQVWPYLLLHSLTISFLVFQPVFCIQLYTPYISSPSPHHLSSSHVHTISVYNF